ncbi:unnamed protein product [Parnassius mnemosyne]|uniref:PiggyBac transposable element-derived protein domain-containing protein n=1 Tax=Parnassius mnemosyne TaxID=213953 RepID=A0AAV1L1E4_9NEOP
MSRCRFEFLTNCLRFDDRDTREERRATDRLAPIREVFDQIVKKCDKYYAPTDCSTIDERLSAFRGRCVFKMYGYVSKPDKYGIKILMNCDSKTAYMLKAIVYVGQTPSPQNMSVPEYYVMELSEPLYGSHRNITMDNWFTSIPLAKNLIGKELTMVGTTRKNKGEIPESFLVLTNREKNTAMFAYDGPLTLLSYCPPKSTKKKVIIMLSTLHDSPDNNEVELPEIIHFYNKTKGGVDVFDAMAKKYSVQRRTKRWPMCIFYGLLNGVGINSWVLYKCSKANNKPDIRLRRSFLKELGMNLMDEHLKMRLQTPTLKRDIKESIAAILKQPMPVDSSGSERHAQGRCGFCPRNRDRKSKTRCTKCKIPICLEHQVKVCQKCSN